MRKSLIMKKFIIDSTSERGAPITGPFNIHFIYDNIPPVTFKLSPKRLFEALRDYHSKIERTKEVTRVLNKHLNEKHL
jgi:hypothetical protein